MKKGLLIVLLVLCISFVSAATINVCPSCNYTSIQTAINNATAGDTINVFAGIYNENININKAITLVGASSATVTVNALVSNVHAFTVTSSNVGISGFTVTGASVDTTAGIYLAAGVENCTISNNNLTGNGDGIWLEIGADYNTIINNYASNNHQGIELHGADYNILINNRANYNTDYNNGFKLEHADHNTFINNTANFNKQHGFYLVAIDGGCNYNTFINNTANYNIQRDGFRIRESHDNTFTGNTANSNTRAGIMLEGNSSYSIFTGNTFTNNSIGLQVRKDTLNNSDATTLIISKNMFRNINLGISYDGSGVTINAINNYWGSCDGPYHAITNPTGHGDVVSDNVDYTPWIGACPEGKAIIPTCVLATDSVTLYANVTGSCIGQVIFSVNKDGTWQNYTGVKTSGIANYSYTVSGLVEGTTVYWTVYADDCYGHVTKNGNENFYVNKRTNATISSTLGLNNWYVTMPWFTLTNPDTTQIFYRWDGTGTHNYTIPFNLTDIPNPPPESAGILKLTYWSNLICNRTEPEQNKMYYIDLTKPTIESSSPVNGINVTCSLRPTISAVISDVYGSNSGVDDNSLIMKIDGTTRTITKQNLNDVKTRISYVPTSDLTTGAHLVQVSGQDNAGNGFNEGFSFSISPGAGFDLNVISPVNKTRESPYGDKQIRFSISTTNRVSKIEYINNNAGWKNLCTRCNSTSKKVSFSDGQHNVTIRAIDACGNQKNETHAFFVDSKEPKIIEIKPKNNEIVNGSLFYIKYSEDNVKSVSLYYGSQQQSLTCTSGNNKVCNTNVSLVNYDGQYINYWFVVSDYLRNVSSKVNRIKVDTSAPIINITSPANSANYTKKVLFKINLNEKAKLKYYDNSVLSPRWTSLCSDCSTYSQTKSFSKGNHNIIIRATDKAGNSASANTSFTIV